jgi:hypothetical protein
MAPIPAPAYVDANMPAQVLFLPGASGNVDFWKPAADLLTHPALKPPPSPPSP